MDLQKALQEVNSAKSIAELKSVADRLTSAGISGFNLNDGDLNQAKLDLNDFINEQIDSFLPSQL